MLPGAFPSGKGPLATGICGIHSSFISNSVGFMSLAKWGFAAGADSPRAGTGMAPCAETLPEWFLFGFESEFEFFPCFSTRPEKFHQLFNSGRFDKLMQVEFFSSLSVH